MNGKIVLIQDTREKVGKHNNIIRYCKSNGIEIIRKTLQVGDYMLGEKCGDTVIPISKISVDIKSLGLTELATDLTKDEQALNKKYRKSYEQGIKLYVLIEEQFDSIYDIAKWKNPHGKIDGRKLLDKMHRLTMMYGVQFVCCDKNHTGETIIKLLKGA